MPSDLVQFSRFDLSCPRGSLQNGPFYSIEIISISECYLGRITPAERGPGRS